MKEVTTYFFLLDAQKVNIALLLSEVAELSGPCGATGDSAVATPPLYRDTVQEAT